MKSAIRSPRTTVMGVAAFLLAIGTALQHQFDADPMTTPDWNVVVTAGILAAGLIASRDNSVNSRKAGAE